jgi:hypothetical protein
MLEYHAGLAGRYADTAIGALFLDYDISAVLAPVDGIFGTSLHTFAALSTDLGLISSRLRKMRLNPKARLLGIYIVKMGNCANLCAQTAAAAFPRCHSNSF